MSRPLVHWTCMRAAAWLRRHGGRIFDAAERTVGAREMLGIVNGGGAPAPEDWLPLEPPLARLSEDASLARLVEAFQLSRIEAGLLALIAAPALRVELERLYRFLRADDRPLTVGFVAELMGEVVSTFEAAAGALHPTRTLVQSGLVVLGAGRGQARTVAVSDDVLDVLRGIEPRLDDRLAPVAPAQWPRHAELVTALARGDALHLIGAPGSGRLAALTAALGRIPIGLDLTGRTPDLGVLRRAWRIARLHGSPLVLRVDQPLEPADAGIVHRWLTTQPCVVLTRDDVELPAARRLHAPHLDQAAQAACWRARLGEGWAADLPERLAARFDLGPGRIAEVLLDQPADEAALLAAIRGRLPHRLDALAERTETRMTWADVVLPAEAEQTLREIVACARHRGTVLDAWGFDRLLPYGRGLGCLFAGPPGTGKTMMAGILASALGRELYRVDLSRLVSKWLGETEKNLSQLFAEAARARAILFFDEADSLFARRTGVKSSNDRHANMEVNHLLQQMERHDGISILATNLEGSIDEAFKRRLRFVVHFEAPDASARAALWERMLPATAPVAEGIRFGRLGRQFKLTGGHIKNAVVRAAYLAADANRPIDEALLVQAAEAETRALGRL